jgi:hypothetical protein
LTARSLNVTLRTSVPWSKAGTGAAVFDMPTYITRVHIVGAYTGVASNFIVHVGRCAIIDDRIGTSMYRSVIDGSYSVTEAGPATSHPDGTVNIIVDSPAVSWSLTEGPQLERGRALL